VSALVSVGLPVYNGERYLREALDSVLAQTYAPLELVITDNASTDGTERICREYAERDARVRYERQARNMGAIWNFNRALELARGEYFLWQAYDDRRRPECVARCVATLEARPDAVLCCTDVALIDEDGRPVDDPTWPRGIHPDGPTPLDRALAVARAGFWYDFYGVARTRVLRTTGLARQVWGFDVVVLLEMCLRGAVTAVREPLFEYRIFRRKTQDDLARTLAPDSGQAPAVAPSWTALVSALVQAVWDAPLARAERARIAAAVVRELCWRNAAVWGPIHVEGFRGVSRAWRAGRRANAAAVSPMVLASSARWYLEAARLRLGRLSRAGGGRG
jgi:glycosyltransferase involved in cell wall biosynthesis